MARDIDTVITKDSVTWVDVADVRDYLGLARKDINKTDEDTEIIDEMLLAARSAIEKYLGRSIIVKDYATTSNSPRFTLMHKVTQLDDVKAWNGKVWLSARKNEFEAQWDDIGDIVFVEEVPQDVTTFKATYKAGYIKIPDEINQAIKDFVRIRYKRNGEDPMATVKKRITPFRWKEVEDFSDDHPYKFRT